MGRYLLFEDGKLVNGTTNINEQPLFLWGNLFSHCSKTGPIIRHLQSILPKNTICVIPFSDGNVEKRNIQHIIDDARLKNKTLIVGTLGQSFEEDVDSITGRRDFYYLYLPLEDVFFEQGIMKSFEEITPPWSEKSDQLCWRGGCSGEGGNKSVRVRFVEALYQKWENIRLSTWWSSDKNINPLLFGNRVDYTEFLNHKIFFIIDGNVIASNHMWGFATGSLPMMISNSKCWFSPYIVPFVHYIPIQYDLADLEEKIEWVLTHDVEAKQIAENALELSRTVFSAEFQQNYLNQCIDEIVEEEKIGLEKRPKIIDGFIFYNELELLQYRFSILYNVVDWFVLVESNYTYAGHSKPLFYKENRHLFEKFQDKIIHIIVDAPYIFPNIDYGLNQQWVNETHQRNGIDLGIKQINVENTLKSTDLIIIADVDEMPDPNRLLEIKRGTLVANDGFTFSQDMYYYNLQTQHVDKWTRAKIVSFSKYSETIPQEVRGSVSLPILLNGGWHLSYFGDCKLIENKIKEFSHQELNHQCFTDPLEIQKKIDANADLFGRSYVPMRRVYLTENAYLPPLYDIYLQNYLGPPIPTYIYFHICCILHWREIVSQYLFKIRHSSLYGKVKEIRCGVLGTDESVLLDPLFQDPKIRILFYETNLSVEQRPTINRLYDDSLKEQFNVLYIHSKEVQHYQNAELKRNIFDWVELLSYYTIYKHDICLELLNVGENCRKADAVGVNLQVRPTDYPLHYSGNFWWSSASHIRKIHTVKEGYYNSPEFWIPSVSGFYASLWHSGVNHNSSPYPSVLYEGKKELKWEIK